MEGVRIQHNQFKAVKIPDLPYEVLRAKYQLFQGEKETGYLIHWNDGRYQLFVGGISLYIPNDEITFN